MTTTTDDHARPAQATARTRRHHAFGFWVAGAAFAVNMGFSAVPTPLYVLYQRRDGFSTFTVTVVYAVYAVGVVGSLFLGGHVSDWWGRRRVLLGALLVNVVSAVVFLLAPGLAGLLVARVVTGISVGLTTATATAWIAELHRGASVPGGRPGRKEQVVATAANLGGIGVGPLVSGLLAQYAPAPLQLPYVAFGAALLVLVGLVAASPETVVSPEVMPAYRPQRVRLPAPARRTFFAATSAGLAAFAVYGLFTSLSPSFLSGTLHQHSHAVAGAVAFAAFAGGAAAQVLLGRTGVQRSLLTGPPVLVVGLGSLVAGMWLPSLLAFVLGGVLAGAGAGIVFRGSLGAVAATAPAESRAEVLSGFFLGAYIGLSVPVLGLGIATRFFAPRDVVLVFVLAVVTAVVVASRAVLRQP